MPVKMVECSVCGDTVSKRQTYSVGDGKRACKKHEGVSEKSKALIDEAAAARRKEVERQKIKRFKPSSRPQETSNELIEVQIWSCFTCWCCGKRGIRLEDLYHSLLIGMSKLELKGEAIDFFNMPKQLADEIGWTKAQAGGFVVVNQVVMPPKGRAYNRIMQDIREQRKLHSKKHLGHYRNAHFVDMVIDMIGTVQVCPDCAAKHNLKFQPDMPELSYEQLVNYVAIAEVMGNPYEEIARRQLAEEAKRN